MALLSNKLCIYYHRAQLDLLDLLELTDIQELLYVVVLSFFLYACETGYLSFTEVLTNIIANANAQWIYITVGRLHMHL